MGPTWRIDLTTHRTMSKCSEKEKHINKRSSGSSISNSSSSSSHNSISNIGSSSSSSNSTNGSSRSSNNSSNSSSSSSSSSTRCSIFIIIIFFNVLLSQNCWQCQGCWFDFQFSCPFLNPQCVGHLVHIFVRVWGTGIPWLSTTGHDKGFSGHQFRCRASSSHAL